MRRLNQWWILAALCLCLLMVVIDNTIVNVALPTFARDLHSSNAGLQWIVDGYALPFAALMFAGGGAADRLGRQGDEHHALVAFAAFSAYASFSTSTGSLIAARALMGAAAAFIFPATLSIVTVVFTNARERAIAFGVWGSVAGIGVALGPIAGGELITHFWYGSVFLVNVPTVALAVAAVWLIVPNSTSPAKSRFDFLGLILGSGAVTTLTLAIIQGPSWGWASATVLVLFGVTLVLGAAFVRTELAQAEPMLDVRVFRSGAFSAGTWSLLTVTFLLTGFIFMVTQYFQLVRGYSALSAGVRTLPFAITTAITTPLGAWAATKWGPRRVVPVGLVVMGSAIWWIGQQSPTSAYFGPVVGSMVLMSVGFSLITAPSTAVTMSALPANQVGAGASVNETTREVGSTLGVAIVGSVFASTFAPRIHDIFAPLVGSGLTAEQLTTAQSSMAAALATVGRLPAAVGGNLAPHVTSAFMASFRHGCSVVAVVAVVSALAVVGFLPNEAQHPVDEPEAMGVK